MALVDEVALADQDHVALVDEAAPVVEGSVPYKPP